MDEEEHKSTSGACHRVSLKCSRLFHLGFCFFCPPPPAWRFLDLSLGVLFFRLSFLMNHARKWLGIRSRAGLFACLRPIHFLAFWWWFISRPLASQTIGPRHLRDPRAPCRAASALHRFLRCCFLGSIIPPQKLPNKVKTAQKGGSKSYLHTGLAGRLVPLHLGPARPLLISRPPFWRALM